jgi:hypothetical protein
MKVSKIIVRLLLFLVLTVISQTGGVVYLFTFYVSTFFRNKFKTRVAFNGAFLVFFVVLYLGTTFFLVPPLARMFGRVPLPMGKDQPLEPVSWYQGALSGCMFSIY